MTWNPIDTIPTDRPVTVKTYTGIECRARVVWTDANGKPHIRPATPQYRKRRVACWRTDKSGDVAAVAWRD